MCLRRCGVFCVWPCTTWVTCLVFCNLIVSDTGFHSAMPQKLVGDLDVRRILSWKHCNGQSLLWWWGCRKASPFPQSCSYCTLSCWCEFPSFSCEHKGLFSHSLNSIGIALTGIGCMLHMIIGATLSSITWSYIIFLFSFWWMRFIVATLEGPLKETKCRFPLKNMRRKKDGRK